MLLDDIRPLRSFGEGQLDAPYIAKKTGTTIIGNETVANLARAYDLPDAQLIVVRGGEDYEFGAFSLRVIPSIHTALFHKHYFSSRLAHSSEPIMSGRRYPTIPAD